MASVTSTNLARTPSGIHLINGEYCFDESPPPSPTPVVPEHVGAQELVASQDPPNLTVPLNSESHSNTEPYSARTETAHESVLPKNWERELNSRMNVLSDEQKRLIKLVEEGRNCFVTGSAGTGKSFTMETVIDFIRSKGRSVVVTAPTVKGQTLNSFFSLGMSPHCIPNVMHMVKRSEEIKWRLKSVDILVIDEISMVSHSVLDLIHKMLCIARESSEPFGGIQMIVSGDFFQLSPVPDGLKCPHCRSEIRGRKISSKVGICQNVDCTATSKPFEFDHRTLMAFESGIPPI